MEYVFSMTSHGNRIKYLPLIIQNLYTEQKQKPKKIYLNLFKDDLRYVTDDLKTLISKCKGFIELIISDYDLGPHLKYFWTFVNHPEENVILVDDGYLYNESLTKELLENGEKYPYAISSRGCRHIGGLDYSTWNLAWEEGHIPPTTGLVAEHGVGCLYTSEVIKKLNITADDIPEIIDMRFNDDFYITLRANKLGILRSQPTVLTLAKVANRILNDIPEVLDCSLQGHHNVGGESYNNQYIAKYSKAFGVNSPKIAILTCSTINRKWLTNLTNKTKDKYAKLYSMDYIFSDEFYPDKTRCACWNKISFLLKYIKNYDWVVWMDDDAGFIRFDEDFSTMLKTTDKQLLYANDVNGFNAGVLFIKSTEEMIEILNKVNIDLYEKFKNDIYQEQTALQSLLTQENSKCIDGHKYNAYPTWFCISKPNIITKDSIIVHIAGGAPAKEIYKENIIEIFKDR